MLNIFQKIKNNSTWLLDDKLIVVYNTSWWRINIYYPDLYPMVYYYYPIKNKNIFSITRIEFLLNATKIDK